MWVSDRSPFEFMEGLFLGVRRPQQLILWAYRTKSIICAFGSTYLASASSLKVILLLLEG